jgi:signal transduction histidine kinase
LKIAGSILLVFIGLSLGLVFISRLVLLDSFEALERAEIVRQIDGLQYTLHDDSNTLSAVVADWAYWDTTYQFALGRDGDALPLSRLYADYGINVMLMVDTLGIPVLASERDPLTGTIQSMSSRLSADLAAILNQIDFSAAPQSDLHGIARVDGIPMLIAARAVLDDRRSNAIIGALVFGKRLDAVYAEQLSDQLLIQVRLYSYGAPDLPDIVRRAAEALLNMDARVVTPASQTEMIGYARVDGIDGRPALLLQVTDRRDISLQGSETIRVMAILLVAAGLILSLILLILLETVITRRVSRLSAALETIHADETLTRRVHIGGDDELNQLAQEVNNLLDRLSESRVQLTEQNQALILSYDKAREANRLKTQFLSTMSHELRTPLNSIIGYSYIMSERMAGQLDDEAHKMIKVVSTSAEHLLGLINMILDLSKIEAGRMEIVESDIDMYKFVDVIAAQMAVLAAEKDLALAIEIDPTLPSLVRGDERRLMQIIINLLSNAVKFTERGTITYATTWEQNCVMIRVRDTGVGIPASALLYIFDEFRQVDGSTKRQHGGTGLGLAIARKLARAMGGDIDVESTVGVGTTFTVRLPFARVSQPSGVAIRIGQNDPHAEPNTVEQADPHAEPFTIGGD